MPSLSFDPKTGETKLAEGTSISSVSIKNVQDVSSYEIIEDNQTLIHKVKFNESSYFTASYGNNSVSVNSTECTTNVSDDPDNESAVILTISPNKK
ncbi:MULTISPECIES: hypothetical protein [Vibrio]|jgi:formate dehydrogenase assembly factor FdhD|uniref:Uncharacterized protein n=2 Tax=Vibrio cyclitrophicus TaxID=47951 RepID=A0A7Z1S362_9VIBR|nr:hypothetical protein [Vibrio cyclitrophicus]PMP25443.1 hypothetical protein BCS91_00135 [Vibrio cyclitrophicus]PMP29216.1 hypothetical protein BCS90_17630 [Vibrio cyclitrophicus]